MMSVSAFRQPIPLCLLYSLLAFSCAAQQPAPDDWARVRGLSADTDVTVQTKSGQRYNGPLLQATEDSLTLDSDEHSQPGRVKVRRDLLKDSVREVRLLNRGASGVAGIAIGTAVGAGIGLLIDSSRSGDDRHLATALFAVVGAALGAGVGRHLPIVKGKIVYLAP